MSLHNFNPNNKSWKMYTNTITSISGDHLTIKPYDGKNLLLEVSGNNNIFFKKGDISYGLEDLIGGGNSNINLTSISGNIIPSSDNAFKLGDVSKKWSNAYINDLSVSSIDVSININPLFDNSGNLGGPTKRWANAYMRDLSVTNISVSGNLIPLNINNNSTLGSSTRLWSNAYINDLSVSSIDVSININPLFDNSGNLGGPTKRWANAYIRDLSVTNISVSGNLIPLNVNNNSTLGSSTRLWSNAHISDLSDSSIDVSININPLFDNSGNLGGPTKQWANAYIRDLSVTNISVSGNLIPLNINNNSTLGSSTRLWSNAYISDLSGIVSINGISWPITGSAGTNGLGYSGLTSSTSILISTGVKVFGVNQTAGTNAFVIGTYVRAFNSTTNYLVGTITNYSATSLTIVAESTGGSGTYSTWTFVESGVKGDIGLTGQAGPAGGTTPRRFFNQDWNLLGTNITRVLDVSGKVPMAIGVSSDGYTVMVYWVYSNLYLTGVGSQKQAKRSVAVYTFTSNSWIQKGQTIILPFVNVPTWRYNEAGGDPYGNDIDYTSLLMGDTNLHGNAMSSDGNIIALSINQPTFGPNAGEYTNTIYTDTIYSFNGTTWIQIASQTSQDSNYRNYASFSFENNIIKRFLIINGNLTKVIIHTLTNGSFVQDSAQISETAVNTSLDVAGSGNIWTKRARVISDDGKVVLFVKEKSIVLFKYNGTIWQQYGNVTLITNPASWSSTYARLSYDGSVFLVGSWDATVNGDINAGMTKIYSYNSSSNSWIQRGQDITYEEITLIDEARRLQYGSDAKCLSGDGSTIIIGTRIRPNIVYNEAANLQGILQAYRYSSISNYWSKVGREITGIAQERPGSFIRSNYTGNIIHVDGGTFQETTTSDNTGRIRVYEFQI